MRRVQLAILGSIGLAPAFIGCSLLNPFDELQQEAVAEAGTSRDAGTSRTKVDSGSTIVDSGAPPSSDASVLDSGGDGAAPTYRDEVISDSPALYARLGEKSGTTATDETGALNGVYTGNGFTLGVEGAIAGDSNTAIQVDGRSSVRFPSGAAFGAKAAFTLEFWAKQSAYDSYSWTIDHFDWGAAAGRSGWGLRVSNNELGVERWLNGNTQGSTGFSTQNILGAFHHIVATFDGASICIYVDTVKSCGPVTDVAIPTTSNVWSFGTRNDCNLVSGCQGFIGALDEFAVYTFSLSEARISAHYARAKGN